MPALREEYAEKYGVELGEPKSRIRHKKIVDYIMSVPDLADLEKLSEADLYKLAYEGRSLPKKKESLAKLGLPVIKIPVKKKEEPKIFVVEEPKTETKKKKK
jgi:hypothetical protein